MTNKEITDGAKLIAEYLEWKYIPFNDLQGLSKAGWYKVKPRNPDIKEVSIPHPIEGGKAQELKIDLTNMILTKDGWKLSDNNYYKHICRKHSDLRFWNSMDALLPVIKKIEKEDLSQYFYSWESEGEIRSNFMGFEFTLYHKGGYSEIELELDPPMEIVKSFREDLTWTQNIFILVVETIKYINNLKERGENK